MDSNYPDEKAASQLRPTNQPPIAHKDQAPPDYVVYTPSHDDPTSLQRRSRKRRVARGLCTVITIWILYTLFFSTFRQHRGHRAGCNGYQSFEEPAASPVSNGPIPPGVIIDNCANLTLDFITATNMLRGRFSSSTTFKLPVSSERLFLLSRGTAAGSVNFVQSDEAGENVKVHVVATYRHESTLDHIKVCSISRGHDEKGVGIFAPRHSGGRFGANFDITVHLPSASKKSPLRIKNFETDLPLFLHDVGPLADTVHFDALSLKTAMMKISVESLSATDAKISTANAMIEGTFNTSSSLELTTSNAPIDVNVGLFNGKNADQTRLHMGTSNAALTARLSLVSGSKKGGHFKVSGATAMGPVDLTVTDAPIGSSLMLEARTALSPATVTLPETYEGEFALATSLRHTVVSVNEDVEDPAGKGRKRSVDIRQAGSSRTSGTVSWSSEGEHLGSIKVETSLALATLNL